MNYQELITDINSCLISKDYTKAVKLSEQAVKKEPKNPEAYMLAGQASMALNDPNRAAQFFSDLVRISPKGDYFFMLGQAQAMNDDGMNAISNFEKALQKNCSTQNKGLIYKMMSMLNVEMGDFEDGLKNIENASMFISLDLDLLKNRYLCYAGLENYKQAVASCNQMKLISPSSYDAYSMILEILLKLEIYDEAEKELSRARRSVRPLPLAYYNDKARYILASGTKNDGNNISDKVLKDILKVYSSALANLYKNTTDFDAVFSVFLRGVQTYLQLKDSENALRLINLMWDIPSAFRRKEPLSEFEPKAEEELEESYNSEFFGTISSMSDDEKSESFEKAKKSLTPLSKIPEKQSQNKHEDIPQYSLDIHQKEIIWELEISAYDLSGDYENMLKSAERLQGSKNISNNYLGKYYALRCKKLLNQENWKKNYENAVGYWKNQRLENPGDLLAMPYEIRCLIDLGRFEDAENMIERLPSQSRPFFTQLLEKEKSESE